LGGEGGREDEKQQRDPDHGIVLLALDQR